MRAEARATLPQEPLGPRTASGVADGGSPAPGAWVGTWALIKLGVGLALVIGVSLGTAWGAREFAMTTPRFAIERVDVQGLGRLTSEEVARQAGVQTGKNIFAMDTEHAERALLANPWIRSARVTRELPRHVRIDIVEHDARAVVSIGTELYLVTRAGIPFKPLADSDPYDIPMITGISQTNLARDRAREIERIALALEVLGQYERLPVAHAFAPQEVHLDADGAVTLVIGRQGVSLRLGKGPWLMKLRMAERVLQKVQRQGKVPGILFLDNDAHPERVVVRMR
jgi:cell division protein FtsQ